MAAIMVAISHVHICLHHPLPVLVTSYWFLPFGPSTPSAIDSPRNNRTYCHLVLVNRRIVLSHMVSGHVQCVLKQPIWMPQKHKVYKIN